MTMSKYLVLQLHAIRLALLGLWVGFFVAVVALGIRTDLLHERIKKLEKDRGGA